MIELLEANAIVVQGVWRHLNKQDRGTLRRLSPILRQITDGLVQKLEYNHYSGPTKRLLGIGNVFEMASEDMDTAAKRLEDNRSSLPSRELLARLIHQSTATILADTRFMAEILLYFSTTTMATRLTRLEVHVNAVAPETLQAMRWAFPVLRDLTIMTRYIEADHERDDEDDDDIDADTLRDSSKNYARIYGWAFRHAGDLSSLHLEYCDLTPTAMCSLSCLSSLCRLKFDSCKFGTSVATLSVLTELPALRHLCISSEFARRSPTEHLECLFLFRLTQLEDLVMLDHTVEPMPGVHALTHDLGNMTRLRVLHLPWCQADVTVIRAVLRLPSLIKLALASVCTVLTTPSTRHRCPGSVTSSCDKITCGAYSQLSVPWDRSLV